MKLAELRNEYALITGASSGLGRAFAEGLAARGMHVVLVARDKERLTRLATRLETTYGIHAFPFPLDLSVPGAPEHLKAAIEAHNITIRLLCNNAAMGYLGEYRSQSQSAITALLELNVHTVVSLCHVFFDHLVSFPQSVIINVSSAAYVQPVPYMAVYAASKSFVHSFSQALSYEWKERGIEVQTLVPGVMDTPFNAQIGIDTRHFKTITPQQVVALSLHNLEKGSRIVSASPRLGLQKWFATFFPAQVVLRVVANLFRP